MKCWLTCHLSKVLDKSSVHGTLILSGIGAIVLNTSWRSDLTFFIVSAAPSTFLTKWMKKGISWVI